MNIETHRVYDLAHLRHLCAACGLRDLCLPGGLDAEGLRRIDSVIQDKRPLSPRETLYHAGSPLEGLFIVRSGSLISSISTENGDLQIVGFHLPGEVIGLDGLAQHRHACTMISLERSRVCELPLHAIHDIVAEVPSLKTWFLDLIGRETMQDYEHVAMMGKRLAHERLASFLLSFSHRYDRLRRDPCRLKLTMSRSELGNYLGLAEETISRLFSRFQEKGLLEVSRKQVVIVDIDGLAAECGGQRYPPIMAGGNPRVQRAGT